MTEGQTEENCHMAREQITFILPYQDIEKSHFLFLGQAIYWIMSRGLAITFVDADEEWRRYTECAQELFNKIDEFRPRIEGYQKGSDGVNEKLPDGIWANMRMEPVNVPNTMGKFFPIFSSIDPGKGREDGGHVMVGEEEWYGVRLLISFVLEHWPAHQSSQDGQTGKIGRPDHQQKWDQSVKWLNARIAAWRAGNGEQMSRSSVEQGLLSELGVRSTVARQVWSDVAPPEWCVRGRRKKSN